MTESGLATNVFKPAKIKVGFQKRTDTYTGQLAYVIYYDQKNKIRKEKSWESWRDTKIAAQEFDNTPASGFVLNKKVGGYKSDWNVRQTMCRIYDPRGFEFEITVPNLLYILENTNSIKGKGLEGDFVYAWDGTELLLLPSAAPEYEKVVAFTDMVTNKEKINKKNIVLGGTYRDGKNTDWIYLGFFDAYDSGYGKYNRTTGEYDKKTGSIGKRHFFYPVGHKPTTYDSGFKFMSSLSSFVKVVSAEPVDNYAELMSKLERQTMYSPYDQKKDKYIPLTAAKLEKIFSTTDNVNMEVFFEHSGIRLTGVIQKLSAAHVKQYVSYPQYNYTERPWLQNIKRVYDIPEEDKLYRTGYSYSGSYRPFTDPKLDAVIRQMKEDKLLGNNTYGGRFIEDLASLTELHNALHFEIRKQFLTNGKVYKEY